MKKILIFAIIGTAIAYAYVEFNVIWRGERIDLKEIGVIELPVGIDHGDFFDDADWLIITAEEQRLNWRKSGYNLPSVNFKERFIILSNHRIKALYKENGCDECTGVPNGFALYDYLGTDSRMYYIYTIPVIRLSQGVG
jgi:hypothetical protein